MLPQPTDRSPSADTIGPIPFSDPRADLGRAQRRPTWWLDESEHARVLGVKPRPPKAPARAKAVAKPPAGPPTPPPPEPLPTADFAELTPTLAALDRILQPPAFDAPGLSARRRPGRARRLGVAVGLATVMAAVVFFR